MASNLMMRRSSKETIAIKTIVSFSVRNWIRSVTGISFISAFFIGLMVHLYAYTNLYLGHDASPLYNYGPTWDISTGRYIGTFIKQLHGSLQLPTLIGLITLLFLGFVSVLISKMLKIKKPTFLILISAIIVTWPTIISMNCYLYMASQFSFAIFAACVAAYISDKYRFGLFIGLPLIIIAMACYQAYWGTCAALMLLCIIRDTLDNELTIKKVIAKGIRFAITLGLGLFLYYGIWMYLLDAKDIVKPIYLGIDSMGYSSIADFFVVLSHTYQTVFSFFFKPNAQSYYPVYVMVAGCVGIVLALYLMGLIIIKLKIYRQPLKCMILIVSLILFPITMNCSEIFSKGETNSVLTRFAFMMPFLFLLMMVSLFEEKIHKEMIHFIAMCMSIIILGLSCLNGLYGANVTYLKIESNYHVSVAQVTQWISRIQAESGYEVDTPVVIVGQPRQFIKKGFEWCDNIAGAFNTSLTYDGPIRNFIKMINPEINLIYDTTSYKNLESVQALRPFPTNDCIVWVDDTLVLKLS